MCVQKDCMICLMHKRMHLGIEAKYHDVRTQQSPTPPSVESKISFNRTKFNHNAISVILLSV